MHVREIIHMVRFCKSHTPVVFIQWNAHKAYVLVISATLHAGSLFVLAVSVTSSKKVVHTGSFFCVLVVSITLHKEKKQCGQ